MYSETRAPTRDKKDVVDTLMLVYHCHKPVFTPKMARAVMRKGGLPLPLAFQYLILLI